jgi:hypothetical protein
MSVGRIAASVVAAGVMVIAQTAWGANLLRNGSFETTPCRTPCNQDQAYLPSEWLALSSTPDTYSNDGSYGLAPDAWGNFVGVTAEDGIRWVAAWSADSEVFGQVLTAALVPGGSYSLSAYVRESARTDLVNPGTYQIELWDSTDSSSANKIVVGSLQPDINNPAAWELRTLAFNAPAQASTYRVLAFRVIKYAGPDVYPAIDYISLLANGSGGICTGSATVVIDGCDSGVPNAPTSNSCIANVIQTCNGAANHGGFVSCVAHVTNDLLGGGIITGQQKSKLQSCAARASLP